MLGTIKDLLYLYLNKADEAIKAFDEAIKINPKASNAWYSKGAVLDKLNKLDEAIKAYDKAIKINPKNSDGLEQ